MRINFKPIGGVINLNDCNEFIYEELQSAINLNFAEHERECKKEYHDDCFETDSADTLLINFKEDQDGKFTEGGGYEEYSAIVGESTMQITKSEYVTLCGICSPCFPDQGDLTSEGDFLTYCLPADLLPEDFKNTIVKYDENFTKLVNHFMVFPFVRSEKESVYIIFDIIKFIGEKNTWNNETKQLDCFDILGYTPPSYIEYSELCYEEEESIKEYYKEDLKQDLPNDDEIEKIAEKLLKDRYYIYPLTGSNSIVIILDK